MGGFLFFEIIVLYRKFTVSFSGSWSRGLLKASSGGVAILLEGRGYSANWGLFAAGRGDDGHGGVRIGGFEVTSFWGGN